MDGEDTSTTISASPASGFAPRSGRQRYTVTSGRRNVNFGIRQRNDVDIRLDANPRFGARQLLHRACQTACDAIVLRHRRFTNDHMPMHYLDFARDILGQRAVLLLGQIVRQVVRCSDRHHRSLSIPTQMIINASEGTDSHGVRALVQVFI